MGTDYEQIAQGIVAEWCGDAMTKEQIAEELAGRVDSDELMPYVVREAEKCGLLVEVAS